MIEFPSLESCTAETIEAGAEGEAAIDGVVNARVNLEN